MEERAKIYEIVDKERDYQDRKWGRVEDHPHEVGAWLTLIRTHLHEAEIAWSGSTGDGKSLTEIRKIIAIGVACAEQHGLPMRYPKPSPLDNPVKWKNDKIQSSE